MMITNKEVIHYEGSYVKKLSEWTLIYGIRKPRGKKSFQRKGQSILFLIIL